MHHFIVGASSGPLRRPRKSVRPNGTFSDPNDGWFVQSVPESNACTTTSSNPRVELVGGRGIDRKRRLHPNRRRGLDLAYSEGSRLVSAGSDSVELQEEENNVHNAFKLRAVLADSLSSAIGNVRSAFANAFGSFSMKIGAAYRSKEALLYPSPTKLSNSPPKLIISISRDDDTTSLDESTSVISLSGVSSFGFRTDVAGSRYRNVACLLIAALLAFAHVCILPKGVYVDVPSTSHIEEPVAMEVLTTARSMGAQTPITSKHLPPPFLRQSLHSIFGVRPQRPTKKSSPAFISSIAKSRAEERIKKMHAKALKGSTVHVLELSDMRKNHVKKQVDMYANDGASRASVWRLLGSSFVPALVKAAGHH